MVIKSNVRKLDIYLKFELKLRAFLFLYRLSPGCFLFQLTAEEDLHIHVKNNRSGVFPTSPSPALPWSLSSAKSRRGA